MCGEKKGRFRPAGGEISFWVSNRVTRVNLARRFTCDCSI